MTACLYAFVIVDCNIFHTSSKSEFSDQLITIILEKTKSYEVDDVSIIMALATSHLSEERKEEAYAQNQVRKIK